MNIFDSATPVWVDSKFTSDENRKLSGHAYSQVKTHNFRNSNSKEAFDTWMTASMWAKCKFEDVSKDSAYFSQGIDFLTHHLNKRVAHEVKFESYTTGNQALEMFTFYAKHGTEGNWKTGWMYSSKAAWLHAIFPCGLALIANMDELRAIYVQQDSFEDYCMAINYGRRTKEGLQYDDKGPLSILNGALNGKPFSHVSFSILSVVEETLKRCEQAYLVDMRELFSGKVLNAAEHFDKPCFIDKQKWAHRLKTVDEMGTIFMNGPEFSSPILPYDETGLDIEFEVFSKLSKNHHRINELKINPTFQALVVEKLFLEPNMGSVFHSQLSIENAKQYAKGKRAYELSKDILRGEWMNPHDDPESFRQACAERRAMFNRRRQVCRESCDLDKATELLKLKQSYNVWCDAHGIRPRYEENKQIWEKEDGRDLRALCRAGVSLYLRDPSFGEEGKNTVHLIT